MIGIEADRGKTFNESESMIIQLLEVPIDILRFESDGVFVFVQ